MKPKNFFLITLVVASVCLGIWWFTQLKTGAPVKIASQTKPADPVTPKQGAPPVIVPPMVLPTTKPDALPVATTPPAAPSSQDAVADPQTDLKTAILDLARLKRIGDAIKVYQTYTRPDKLDPQRIPEIEEYLKRLARNPELQLIVQNQNNAFARALEDLEFQTPTYNDAGDEATYWVTPPLDNGVSSDQFPAVFVRIDGKWYVKPKN